LRARGADKGDAVRRFMTERPMAGTVPVFVGDDLTDEAGFVAVNALEGWGVLVGGGARDTAARYRLAGVAAVHAWLDELSGEAMGVPA
jgi:trehalose 6-phosphate phosphatase